MKSELKARVKRSLLNIQAVSAAIAAYKYDAGRYLRFSSTRGPFRTRQNLAAKITERYHNLEKGLSLPEPRPGFGAPGAETLIRLVRRYVDQYGEDDVTSAAIGALREYDQFNSHSMEVGEAPHSATIAKLVSEHRANPSGVSGTRPMLARDVERATVGVDLNFFTTRHSTRVFAQRPIDGEALTLALAAAQTSPAVCNRQFAHIRTWTDQSEVSQLLEIQGGARGFAHNVPAVALITVDLRSYWSADERNQGWIDGGLYAMAFLLGLHAAGLGAVPLNWSKRPERDRLMRQAVPEINESESIIMLVAFGHLQDEYRVAASPRITSRGTARSDRADAGRRPFSAPMGQPSGPRS